MPPKRVKKVMTLPINVIFSHLQVRFVVHTLCCSLWTDRIERQYMSVSSIEFKTAPSNLLSRWSGCWLVYLFSWLVCLFLSYYSYTNIYNTHRKKHASDYPYMKIHVFKLKVKLLDLMNTWTWSWKMRWKLIPRATSGWKWDAFCSRATRLPCYKKHSRFDLCSRRNN